MLEDDDLDIETLNEDDRSKTRTVEDVYSFRDADEDDRTSISIPLSPSRWGECCTTQRVPMRLAALLLLALAAGTPIPPGRPAHWFSCTANLAGGDRLPFTFCNSSAPLDDRIADLLSRLTYAQKAQVLVSNGQSFSALGLPTMGSGE